MVQRIRLKGYFSNFDGRSKKGDKMILLHKINGTEFTLNPNLIEILEETPDTVITLINSRKYIIKETREEILNKIVEYQRSLFYRIQV